MKTITTVGAFVLALGFLPLLAQDAADNGVRYFSPNIPTGVMHWFKSVPAGSPWIAFGVEVHSDTGYAATGL